MAVGIEADYTLERGEAMATTETAANTPASTQPDQVPVSTATTDQVLPLSRFDQMVDRMKGTGRIVGDIISPDPEIWTCEVE